MMNFTHYNGVAILRILPRRMLSHLLIQEDPDLNQNLISSSVYHHRPPIKVHGNTHYYNVLSNGAYTDNLLLSFLFHCPTNFSFPGGISGQKHTFQPRYKIFYLSFYAYNYEHLDTYTQT